LYVSTKAFKKIWLHSCLGSLEVRMNVLKSIMVAFELHPSVEQELVDKFFG